MDDWQPALTANLHGWGAKLVGFADLTGLTGPGFDRLRQAVSIGVRLADVVVDPVASGPTALYARHYSVANRILDELGFRAAVLLADLGWRALPVPATYDGWRASLEEEEALSLFPHKTAATRAGLGWIGKNALLITPEYGPRVRLVTVLTDAPLAAARPVVQSSCGECMVCVNTCPAGAIKGARWTPGMARSEMVDAHACREAMRTRYASVGMVCGVCMSVCPQGRHSRGHKLQIVDGRLYNTDSNEHSVRSSRGSG